jgi:hypothetical protein
MNPFSWRNLRPSPWPRGGRAAESIVPVQIQTGAKKEALGFRLWALGGEPAETRNAPKEGIEKEHENQPRLWVDPFCGLTPFPSKSCIFVKRLSLSAISIFWKKFHRCAGLARG